VGQNKLEFLLLEMFSVPGTLAYFASKKKVTVTPNVNVMIVCLSLMVEKNKLECLSLKKFSV
jgi:hypothetical protein